MNKNHKKYIRVYDKNNNILFDFFVIDSNNEYNIGDYIDLIYNNLYKHNIDPEFYGEAKFIEQEVFESDNPNYIAEKEFNDNIIKSNNKEEIITDENLILNGFINSTDLFRKHHIEVNYNISNYNEYKKDLNDYIIVMKYNLTITGRKWKVFVNDISNNMIGCAEIDNKYQFNLLMNILDVDYRL